MSKALFILLLPLVLLYVVYCFVQQKVLKPASVMQAEASGAHPSEDMAESLYEFL